MNDNYLEGERKSPPNYWLVSTVVLATILVIGGVALLSYTFGRKSSIESEPNAASVKPAMDNLINRRTESPANNTSTTYDSLNKTPITSANMIPQSDEGMTLSITGDMFVVTRSRENIRLALVEVCVMSESKIVSWIRQKQDRGRREYVVANGKLEAERARLQAIKKELAGTTMNDSAYFEIQRREIDENLKVGLAEDRRYYWISPEYYLDGLVGCDASTKTDADGRFTLTLPKGNRYAIAAQTSRKILDSSETYWWLIWIDPNNPSQHISLNNDNLMAENPSNKVISIARYVPGS